MLKHMLNTNGSIANRGSRPDNNCIIMDTSRINGCVDNQTHRYNNSRTTINVNNSRISQQYPLNASTLHNTTLDTSKHSVYSTTIGISGGGGPGGGTIIQQQQQPQTSTSTNKLLNGGLNISNRVRNHSSKFIAKSRQVGVKEMLVSLGLLCLVSLLLALLSLIFLLKISPVTANDIRELLRAEQLTVITAEEYVVVYEVTLALCALTLSLNLCCLLVCAIQFLFAVKLVKSPHGGNDRTNKYLQKSSISRVCAVGGFFISIPVFLTGIILYTFIQFHSTPAIVTSVFIGLGIIFCGCAMVHNVFIWQREKTNAVKELALQQHEQSAHHHSFHSISGLNTHQTSSPPPPPPPPLPPQTTNLIGANLNHSHVSCYNQSFLHPLHGNGPFIVRPSTTTPPSGDNLNLTKMSHPREASGSISPGMPTGTLDLSSVATTNSPHELSTLV